MKKKIIKYFLFSNVGLVVLCILILIPIIMIYCAFGGEISDSEYVEGNYEYADEFINILNKKVIKEKKGYVPLSRIMYFYNEETDYDIESIYDKNLNEELNIIKPIFEVCNDYYSYLDSCKDSVIVDDEYSIKPFTKPINFDDVIITSFFGNERIVFDNYNVHYAWDFAGKEGTNIYSIGDGKVKKVRFNQNKNTTDKSNGLGNYLEIEYMYNDEMYDVIYGHLYPNSTTLKVGDEVKQKEVIASMGTTGYSTGNHLHFQVSHNGNKIDGLNLIDLSI